MKFIVIKGTQTFLNGEFYLIKLFRSLVLDIKIYKVIVLYFIYSRFLAIISIVIFINLIKYEES